MGATREVGRHGEDIALRWGEERGWEVLARNWRCTQGEADLVVRDGTALVIVEVKTRRSAAFGSPQEAVTRDKVARLRRIAGAWLADDPRRYSDVRVDVLAVRLARVGAASVEHLRGVE
ncbi:YraN family protein [Demequina sp. NBRC 110055]|uniref:YraN family protein n=1 Tax=Demequina sp. NBRC 110055 TaxID=1570344 RepID=UPI0009FFB950|nr:YraN family protein [Demequina sp. NBRC 110055]